MKFQQYGEKAINYMKMNINAIVICGKQNSGKTTIIRKIIDYFRDDKKFIVKDIISNPTDAIAIIELKNKKTIGIVSGGDAEETLIQNFKKLSVCDYYLSPAHLYGETIHFYSKPQLSSDNFKEHIFSFDTTLFIRKTQGKDIETKGHIDNPDIINSNEHFKEMIVELVNYLFD